MHLDTSNFNGIKIFLEMILSLRTNFTKEQALMVNDTVKC